MDQNIFSFGDHLSNSHNLLYSLCNDIVGRKLILVTQGGGGGGKHSLNWPRQVCVAEQGMVLNRVYNFTSKHLEQGVFLD